MPASKKKAPKKAGKAAQSDKASKEQSKDIKGVTIPARANQFTPQITEANKRKMLSMIMSGVTVTRASEVLGIDITTHYLWTYKDPEYAEAAKKAKYIGYQTLIEKSEQKLAAAIDEATPQSVEHAKWLLERLGKHMGWSRNFNDAEDVNAEAEEIPESQIVILHKKVNGGKNGIPKR